MGALAVVLITAAPVAADAYQVPAPPSPTASCDVISPVAIPCVALGKFADAVAAECRRVGVPDARCVLPLAHRVTQAARDAYLQSWVHRTARFQDALQDPVPLRETQWLGTHNSFNSLSDSFTVSHADSNQQLSLAQQLDIDVRALELDLHYLPRLEGHGAPGVTVCHGLGPKNANLGCTVEPLLATVLPQIANWLNAPGHTEEVILLYLEDQLKNASAYESVVATLDQVLRRADGTSLIYRPNPARRATNGCVPLPLDVSREEIRASGARAVLVGSCAPGWSWAPDEPRAGAGACALQGADGRWVAASCGDPHPAACRDAAGRWTVTPAPVVFAGAALACTAIGADFTLPRTGNQNARLHAVAGPAGGAWVHYLLPP